VDRRERRIPARARPERRARRCGSVGGGVDGVSGVVRIGTISSSDIDAVHAGGPRRDVVDPDETVAHETADRRHASDRSASTGSRLRMRYKPTAVPQKIRS